VACPGVAGRSYGDLMQIRLPDPVPEYARLLPSDPSAPAGLVFVAAPAVGDGWSAVQAELTEAFELTRSAVQEDTPVLYVVDNAALLGQTGPGNAMVATGLLSAARTAAVEGAKRGATCNVLAVGSDSDPGDVALWVDHLMSSTAVNGEVVRLGSGHLGKALP